MHTFVSRLSESEQEQLFSDLYYLNLAEVRAFCDNHAIPYRILIETEDGKTRKSRDNDRKKIVIERIVEYLKTGKIKPPTIFRKEIVRLSGLPENITAKDRLYYGCYEKKNPQMMSLLSDLTGGEFKNGAVARILCREFWTRGEAPTFEEFSRGWLKARDDYSLAEHPEAAYLTDLSKGKAGKNWKALRQEKAAAVLKMLSDIEKPGR